MGRRPQAETPQGVEHSKAHGGAMLGQVVPLAAPLPGRPAAAESAAPAGEARFNGESRLAPRTALAISRGQCRPFGATLRAGGVNFALFSRHAQAVQLLLYSEGHEEPFAEVPLDPVRNRTGDVWHVFVHNLPPEVLYGYRVQGPFAPRHGH